MISQLIIGTNDLETFEILKAESTVPGYEKIQRKTLDLQSLIKSLSDLIKDDKKSEILVSSFDTMAPNFKNVLKYYKMTNSEYFIYHQKECKIRTFYNNKPYKINQGHALVILKVNKNRISELYIYPYQQFKGNNTLLFFNPMPNTYNSGAVCIGSLDRTFSGNVGKDIKRIIEGTYTHSHTDFKKGTLSNTKEAFEYLSKNNFPYNELKKLDITLEQAIHKIILK